MIRQKLQDEQLAARNTAFMNGIDPADLREWRWPFTATQGGASDKVIDMLQNKLGLGSEDKPATAVIRTSE